MKNLYPFFENEVSCVFSTDENYYIYLGVAIQSLICNSSSNNNYGIYILEENLSENSKKQLLQLARTNIKIKFINIKELTKDFNDSIFYTCAHFTKVVYYRFFIPEIFSNFRKVIYLDCDLVINTDIKDLYGINLSSKNIGAIKDINKDYTEYIKYKLGLNPEEYFNSGVVIYDITKLKNMNYTDKCIEVLEKIQNPIWVDQDISNIVLVDNVKFIDGSWNILNHNWLFDKWKYSKNSTYYRQLEKYIKSPKIIHYTASPKPWADPGIANSSFFWKYAKISPFYEMIIYKNMENKIHEIWNKNCEKCIENKKVSQEIFSVKNEYSNNTKHKVITILGVKIKFKVKTIPQTLVRVERERERERERESNPAIPKE